MFDRAPDGISHRLYISDILFHHGVRRQRLDRIGLNLEFIATTGQLEQLYGSGADVQTDDWGRFLAE